MDFAIALALFAALAIASSASKTPPPAQPIDCPSQLVSISACLPHVAGPPNVPTPAPTTACCAAFLPSVGDGGDGACFCHLIRDPLLLGFPIDAARVVSLFFSCGAPNASAAADSFAKICRESQSLPPLRSVTPPGADKLSPASAQAPVLPGPGQPSPPKESNTTKPSPMHSPGPRSDASVRSPMSGGGGFFFTWSWMVAVFFLACL